MGCVFPMVIVSIPAHAEFGPNDHREDAPHFILKLINFKTTKIIRWKKELPRMTNFCPRWNHGNLYLLCYCHSFYVAFVLMTRLTFCICFSPQRLQNRGRGLRRTNSIIYNGNRKSSLPRVRLQNFWKYLLVPIWSTGPPWFKIKWFRRFVSN